MDDVVDIGVLLRAAASAATAACRVIRGAHAERMCAAAAASGSAADGAATLRVRLKDAADPQSALTVADEAAQAAILGPLLARFPALPVVAEEDLSGWTMPPGGAAVTAAATVAPDGPAAAAADRDWDGHEDGGWDGGGGGELDTPPDLRSVPLRDVCLFVDPLDGTREFVEGRLSSVQTLLGITVRGVPVAAAIGLPFPSPVSTTSTTAADASVAGGGPTLPPPVIIRALVGAGVAGLPRPPASLPAPHSGLVLALSAAPAAAGSMAAVAAGVVSPDGGVVRLGGAGNKLLALATGRAHAVVLAGGTSVWDTAAPEALVRVLGGELTDLYGRPLRYAAAAAAAAATTSTVAAKTMATTPLVPAEVANAAGVVATAAAFATVDAAGRCHGQLVAEMAAALAAAGHPEDGGGGVAS